IPDRFMLNFKINGKYKTEAKHVIKQTGDNMFEFLAKSNRKVIGESNANRFVFFHGISNVSLNDDGEFPVFGTLKLLMETQEKDGTPSSSDSHDILKIVGATFGTWFNDVLHPAVPFQMRVANRHYKDDFLLILLL
ncbi:hypothetical protein HK100_007925, partial [Physocladia obscura]